MKIRNKTTKRVFTQKGRLLTTHTEHAQGLMFSKKTNDFGLVFSMDSPQKIPIHMMFVFYKIDVAWINEQKQVIDLRKSAPPFHPYICHKGRAQYLLEIPQGLLQKTNTKIGDVIEWDEK